METARPPPTLAFQKQVVLIVDDEPEIRATLAATFRRAMPDVEVVTAEHGEAGLTALQGRPFDLVLSDHRMPGMSGLDLLAQARDLQPGAIRLLMTAYPEMDLVIRGINEHLLARFLTKPFRARDVVGLVSGLLEARRAQEMQQRAFARSSELILRRGAAEAPADEIPAG